jgi:hypothetical protein
MINVIAHVNQSGCTPQPGQAGPRGASPAGAAGELTLGWMAAFAAAKLTLSLCGNLALLKRLQGSTGASGASESSDESSAAGQASPEELWPVVVPGGR